MPELFPTRPESSSTLPWAGSMAFSSGPNGTAIHSHTRIKIGTTTVNDLDLVKSRRGIAFDAVGLLPTAILHRNYISYSGGYAGGVVTGNCLLVPALHISGTPPGLNASQRRDWLLRIPP